MDEVNKERAAKTARKQAKEHAALMWPQDRLMERRAEEERLYIKYYRDIVNPIVTQNW